MTRSAVDDATFVDSALDELGALEGRNILDLATGAGDAAIAAAGRRPVPLEDLAPEAKNRAARPRHRPLMSHFYPMLHVALLHGVEELSTLRERVRMFAAANASVPMSGPIAVFAGDEVAEGRSYPDRTHDLSGAPLFLVLSPLASDAIEAGMDQVAETLGRCSARVETWFLRQRFVRVAQRAESIDRSWLQIVMMNVDPLAESEFNEWDEQEHVVRIANEAPEFVGVQLLETVDGWPRHHEFWRLTDRKALERDPWRSASETAWTRRIRRFTHDCRALLMAPIAA